MATFVPCECWKFAAALRCLPPISQRREGATKGESLEEQFQRFGEGAHFADPEAGRNRNGSVG